MIIELLRYRTQQLHDDAKNGNSFTAEPVAYFARYRYTPLAAGRVEIPLDTPNTVADSEGTGAVLLGLSPKMI